MILGLLGVGILVFIAIYYMVIWSINDRVIKKPKCPACKCECNQQKSKKVARVNKPAPPAKPMQVQLVKSAIESEANSLFLSWLEECKKQSKHVYVNLLACVRWYKLRKYLKVDYADELMIARRKIAHMVLDRLGNALCSHKTGNPKRDMLVTKELSATYSNTRENLRQLKLLKKNNPTLELPVGKMCTMKDGTLAWAPP
jgi:hypothetical protein